MGSELTMTAMLARGSLGKRLDFFSLDRVLRSRGFRVFQNNPSYLTIKKSGVTINVYRNGKATLFFRDWHQATGVWREIMIVSSGGN